MCLVTGALAAVTAWNIYVSIRNDMDGVPFHFRLEICAFSVKVYDFWTLFATPWPAGTWAAIWAPSGFGKISRYTFGKPIWEPFWTPFRLLWPPFRSFWEDNFRVICKPPISPILFDFLSDFNGFKRFLKILEQVYKGFSDFSFWFLFWSSKHHGLSWS